MVFVMKIQILLGALLLSASPVFADDFVYIKCDSKTVRLTKDLRSNQFINREVDTDLMHFKIDSKNSQIMESRNGEWEEVKIDNGLVVVERANTTNGITMEWKVTFPVDPPGKYVANSLSLSDYLSQSAKGSGICKRIDETVYEKTMNQPN